MSITITLSAGQFALIGLSLALFITCWVLCWQQGLLDAAGSFMDGLNGMFTICIFALLWLAPSLAAWAVWATWFRGAA